jgi:GPH family glycoside/pentoside/hexuronide:cation symporter
VAKDVPELPLANRLLYASGSLGGNVIGRSKDLWLIYFYVGNADVDKRVPILLLGALFTAARLIEALDDPLIGWWSDRTSSRWGRRIPFVVLSTPFYALFFVLLWTPPIAGESLWNALYFFLALEAFHLFSTLSGGPFESLLPEIAVRSKDRVNVVAWQVAFGTVGAAIALVGSGIIRDAFGFQAMAIVMAVLGMSSRYLALTGAWRHVRLDVEPARLNPIEAVRSTFTNSQFLFFLPTFILFNMAISMMTAALPFWSGAVLLGDFPAALATAEGRSQATLKLAGLEMGIGEGTVVALLTAAAILVVLLSLPFAYRLAVRRGKAWVYSAAMLIGGVYLPFIAFMGFVPGVDTLLQAMIFVAFMGVPMAAVFTFPNAIQADIIDYDELRTGMRREAVYYGTQATLEKTASALFPLILTSLLILGSTADNPVGIRLVGPVAGLSAMLGFLAFRGYWLPDTVTAETVAARQRNSTARGG